MSIKEMILRLIKGKMNIQENIIWEVRDSKGNLKKIFQPFTWAAYIIKHFGVQCPQNFLFGYWSSCLKVSNLVVDAGLAGAASRINGAGAEAAFTYLEIGIGTTAADHADTTLESAISTYACGRAAATCTRVTTTVTNDTAQLVKSWTVGAGGSFAVTESGIFNNSSAGTMLARQVFSAINIAAGDSLQVTWTVQAT